MLRFAVAGSPISTPLPGGTLEGLKQTSELGIGAMEIEWVQRVPDNTEHMEQIRKTAETLDIVLTVHAPYYINLNAQEPPKLEASKKRIVKALSMAQLAGARSVCVHPAFYLSMDPDVVFDNVYAATDEIMKLKDQLMDSYYGEEGRLVDGDQARKRNEEIEQKARSDQFYNQRHGAPINASNTNIRVDDEVD